MKRVKLLLLIPHLGGGGAERVMSLLAQHLDQRLFAVDLAVVSEDQAGALPIPAHVTVHRLGCSRVRYATLHLFSLVWRLRPDLILSSMAHLNFLLLLLRPLLPADTRVLVRQNTTASREPQTLVRRWMYRVLYRRADQIICQSSAMACDLVMQFGAPEHRVAVLANPISPCAHRAVEAAPDGSGRPRLLAVGRLAPEKGVDLLLPAFVAVLRRYPRATLTILGEGAERPSLTQLAGELGIADSVRFVGYADPAAFFSHSDLFVASSRHEGLPNSLLEAAAAGLPIVTTPSSEGVCDLLDGAPGTWVASNVSVAALAGTLLLALDSLQSLPASARCYHHAFLAPFGIATSIRSYQELLLSVAGLKAG